MLETCLHVHDDHIVLAEDEVGQNRLEHHVLGADAAGSAGIDRTHDEKLDAVDILGELFGEVGDLGVQLIEAVLVVCAGALLGELLHFGDGDDGVDLFFRETERQTQIGVRVDVGSENRPAFVGVESCKSGRKRGLADAALAGDSYFHMVKTF